MTHSNGTRTSESEGNMIIEKCCYAMIRESDQHKDSIDWILDSGATAHMSGMSWPFNGEDASQSARKVVTANGQRLRIHNQQDVELYVENDFKKEKTTIVLADVLYVPEIIPNIISVPKLSTGGFRVEFYGKNCRVTKGDKTIFIAKLNNGHFTLKTYTTGSSHGSQATKIEEIHSASECSISELPSDITEPEDWEELTKCHDHHKIIWERAMKDEMKTLQEADVWDEIPIPRNAKILPCKWTYKIKVNEDNMPVSAKARLVVKGCSQRPGHDYDDTYAPVVKSQTIRILLTLAGHLGWRTKHCDVKAAFLYGNLDETLYMKLPKGPWINDGKNNCYRLKRAMYGLKQAARAWNLRIHTTLTKFDLTRSEGDKCLYYNIKNTDFLFVIIHVDDLLMLSNNNALMDAAVRHINQEYTLKDLGEVSLYLGMHISRDADTGSFRIHQRPKIIKLISDMNLEESYGKDTPMSTEFLRSKPEDTSQFLDNNEKYQRIIGSLMYLSTISRPDICISTNILGRAVARPTTAHWEGVKRIVKYLKHTINLELNLRTTSDCQLNAYCDADWGGDLHDRKSTSGGAIFLGSSLVGWHSRKQKSVALSSAEAEYMSLSTIVQELAWIDRVVYETQINSTLPITVRTDSQSAINIASQEGQNGRSKHIDIRRYYVKDKIDEGFIQLKYCPTGNMVADTFTKPLDKIKFNFHRMNLQLEEMNGHTSRPEDDE